MLSREHSSFTMKLLLLLLELAYSYCTAVTGQTIPTASVENVRSHPTKSYALSFLIALRGFQALSPFVNPLFKLLRCRCVTSRKLHMAKKCPPCIDFHQALGFALLRDLLVSPTKLPSSLSNNCAIQAVSTNRRCSYTSQSWILTGCLYLSY